MTANLTQQWCSPANFDVGKKTGTCYTRKAIKELAKSYNEEVHNPSNAIKMTSSKNTLHKRLSEKMRPQCGDNETCWLYKIGLSSQQKEDFLKAFRPQKPTAWYTNIRMWLNSNDIQQVMTQYNDKYMDFSFLGVFPIDFEEKTSSGSCIVQNMCNFNLQNMIASGKYRYGMIVNTDPHYKGGQHWFAIYFNINKAKKNFGIYLYDSTGSEDFKVPPQMKTFMKHIKDQVKHIYPKDGDKFEIVHNKIRKQYKGTECGIFSIVFLTQCNKNVPFKKICKKMHSDDMMVKFRDWFYRPSSNQQEEY